MLAAVRPLGGQRGAGNPALEETRCVDKQVVQRRGKTWTYFLNDTPQNVESKIHAQNLGVGGSCRRWCGVREKHVVFLRLLKKNFSCFYRVFAKCIGLMGYFTASEKDKISQKIALHYLSQEPLKYYSANIRKIVCTSRCLAFPAHQKSPC